MNNPASTIRLREADIALLKCVIRPAGDGSRKQVYDDRCEEAVLSTASNIPQTVDSANYCRLKRNLENFLEKEFPWTEFFFLKEP